MTSKEFKEAIEALCEAPCFDEITNKQRASMFQELAGDHLGYAAFDDERTSALTPQL